MKYLLPWWNVAIIHQTRPMRKTVGPQNRRFFVAQMAKMQNLKQQFQTCLKVKGLNVNPKIELFFKNPYDFWKMSSICSYSAVSVGFNGVVQSHGDSQICVNDDRIVWWTVPLISPHLSGPGSSIINLHQSISLGQCSCFAMPGKSALMRVTPHRSDLSDTIMSPFHMLYQALTLLQPSWHDLSRKQTFALIAVLKTTLKPLRSCTMNFWSFLLEEIKPIA